MDYIIESLDNRPGWHKVKTIRNIIKIETTPHHFILTTSKNKTLNLRTDTWHPPRPVQAGQGWHELPDASGKAPEHVMAATKANLKNILRQPMKQVTQTDKFKKDFRRELTRLKRENRYDTTIEEFQRWLKEDLMPFDQKPLFEQVMEKIDYEEDIGNKDETLKDIFAFVDIWIENNIGEQEDTNIWYHGTTEDNYKRIKASGELKVSTPETRQHSGFEHDIGTISLAKYHSMAHFFSAISGAGKKNQVILHIDTRQLDPAFTSKRKLINTPDGEMLYRKNIPVSAIVKAETVYTAR